MNENNYFEVLWERHPAPAEQRRFEDWEAAKAFFEEVAADPKTERACLLDVTEKEVRSFERERAGGLVERGTGRPGGTAKVHDFVN